jgi:hypothetical protein
MLYGTSDLAAAGAAAAVQPQLQAYSSEAGSKMHLQQRHQQQHSDAGALSTEHRFQLIQPGIYEQLRAQLLADNSNSSSAVLTAVSTSGADSSSREYDPRGLDTLVTLAHFLPPAAAAAAASPGSLPPRWFQVLPRLTQLRVVGCGARGRLPAELAAARQLNSLVLSHNKLTGSLPEQLVQLQVRLQEMSVAKKGAGVVCKH